LAQISDNSDHLVSPLGNILTIVLFINVRLA